MAQNFVRKSSQKNVEQAQVVQRVDSAIHPLNNWGLDYTFLLEVSIKGNVLNFTDDKAKRSELNKSLGRIAATATAACRNNTGRA